MTTNADLRHASKSQSAPALDELWDIAFHWDDLMIAAHASGGDDIRADALLSARAVDVASSLRAAEERAVDRAHEQQRHRLILQWIKWVLAVIALALFVAAPAVLLSTMLRIEADREKYAAQLGSTHHAGDVEASELAPA